MNTILFIIFSFVLIAVLGVLALAPFILEKINKSKKKHMNKKNTQVINYIPYSEKEDK